MRASGKNCKTKNVSKSLIGVVVLGEHNEEKKGMFDTNKNLNMEKGCKGQIKIVIIIGLIWF